MKTAGLTTLGYEPSVSLGILFFSCSASLRGPLLRTFALGDGTRVGHFG
jgi:hypothetical protein